MSYTFSHSREKNQDYPEMCMSYTVEDEVTHEQLCEEFYYFLRGCGFHFKEDVIGIGVITQEE